MGDGDVKTLRVFTRWPDAKYFSRRCEIELARGQNVEDIPSLVRERLHELRHGEVVLVQWQDAYQGDRGGNILVFRVESQLEQVKL